LLGTVFRRVFAVEQVKILEKDEIDVCGRCHSAKIMYCSFVNSRNVLKRYCEECYWSVLSLIEENRNKAKRYNW